MVDDGYSDVVNVDISSMVIEAMHKKYKDHPHLKSSKQRFLLHWSSYVMFLCLKKRMHIGPAFNQFDLELQQRVCQLKVGIGGFSMGAACFAMGRYGNGIPYHVNLRAVVGLSGWLPGSRSLRNKIEVLH